MACRQRQTGGLKETERGRQADRYSNSNSKTLFYNDCSLGSVKNQAGRQTEKQAETERGRHRLREAGRLRLREADTVRQAGKQTEAGRLQTERQVDRHRQAES